MLISYGAIASILLLALGLVAHIKIRNGAGVATSNILQNSLIETSSGLVSGRSFLSAGVAVAFLGVPYAQPPVGKNRWQPPLPPLSWGASVFSAHSYKPACIGNPTPGVTIEDMAEDCLYLDIYTPKVEDTTEKLLPVMVFLHGGSLVEGSGTSIQSGYGAVANVTRLGVLSIAVNYRLGVLGFLALHTLAAADVRGIGGNYGLLDCVAALTWIQENIVAFGGDPSKVTVYGQSSGGSLVLALAVSPIASGLFHAGISMSGSPRLTANFQEATALHREVIYKSKCKSWAHDDTLEHTALRDRLFHCLQSLNKTELVDALPRDWDSASFSFLAFSPRFRYSPLLVVDRDTAVPSDYLAAYRDPPERSPLAEGVSLMIGVTREEIDFAPGDDVREISITSFQDFIKNHMNNLFNGSFIEKVIRAYGLRNASNADNRNFQQTYAQIVSDATIYCPTLTLVDATFSNITSMTSGEHAFLNRGLSSSPRRGKVYVYSTSQTPGQQSGFCPLKAFQSIPGYCPHYAFHAIDLFALFSPDWTAGAPSSRYISTKEDRFYEELMARRFAEFAKTGAVQAWDTYDAQSQPDAIYSVVDLVAPGESNVANLRSRKCSLWKSFYNELGLIN